MQQSFRLSSQTPVVLLFLVLAMPLGICLQTAIVLGQSPDTESSDTTTAVEAFQLPVIGSNAKWEETYRAEDRFPPPPRELARALTRGYEAFAAGEMLEATGWLQQVIERPAKEDFLVRGPNPSGSPVSMSWVAHTLFCALPAKDRQLFDVRHGAAAERELEAAVADRDEQALAEVMRRYPYTDAGVQAGLLLGYERYYSGRPGLAASLFRRLRMIPEARKAHDPSLTVLLALCYQSNDQSEAAQELLKQLSVPAGTQINIAGRQVQWFQSPDEALSWLKELSAAPQTVSQNQVGQWWMGGGGWNRLKASGSGFPMKNCRWQVPRVNDVLLEKNIAEVAKSQNASQTNLSVVTSPVVVGQTVIVRSFDRVMGIELSSGRRVWYYPAIESLGLAGSLDNVTSGQTSSPEEIQQWMQRQGGADDLASDGQRVFFVEQNAVDTNLTSGIWINGARSTMSSTNQLVALNVKKQGSLEWIVGGPNGSEAKLENAYFLGPPLPIEDELYCLVYLDNLVQLIQLDAETGKLHWQQALAAIESVIRLDNGSQQSLSPAYANGVLVCPTGLGVVVGIDLATRELAWGFSYLPQQQVATYSRMRDEPMRWLGAATQIVGRNVILTPQEADKLYCIDLITGEQKWDEPPQEGRRRVRTAWQSGRPASATGGVPRNDYQLVVAADAERIVNVGRNKIRAISLDDGSVVWERELNDQQLIGGTGFFNHGKIWLPTINSQIITLNMQNGEIESTLEMPWSIQSMICTEREIIATSMKHVGGFFQGEVAEDIFDRLIAGDQSSPVATAELDDRSLDQMPIQLVVFRGQLLRYQNQWSQAVRLFDYAYRRQPLPDHEQWLASTILEALRDDAESGGELFSKYADLLQSRDPVAVYHYQIEGLLSSENYSAAIEPLLSLAKLPAETETNLDWVQTRDPNVRLSWAQWGAAKFQQLLAATSGDQDLQVQQKLLADSQRCLENGQEQQLLRRCEVLGRYGVSPQQQVTLAESLLRSGQFTQAQWLLTPLLTQTDQQTEDYSDSSALARARLLAAEVLWQANFTSQAIAQLRTLPSGMNDQVANVVQRWQASGKVPPSLPDKDPQQWRKGWWATDKTVRSRIDVSAVTSSGTWSYLADGQVDRSWNLSLPLRWRPNENILEVYDSNGHLLSSEVLSALANRRRDPRLQSSGYGWGTMVLATFGEELVMFDWLGIEQADQQSQLWLRDLASHDWELLPGTELGPVRSAIQFDEEYQLFRRGPMQLFGAVSSVSEDGFLVDTGHAVCFLSTLTGEVKWKRTVEPAVLSIAQGSDSFCLYCEEGQVLELDKTTGQVIGQSQVPFTAAEEVVSAGRFVICKTRQGRFVLRVWDLFAKRWIWEESDRELEAKEVELAVDAVEGSVCWATDAGRVCIADLGTGQRWLDSSIEKHNIVGIELQTRSDCWVIVTKHREMSNWQRSNGKLNCSPIPEAEELLAGQVYCFDKPGNGTTTRMRWQSPVPIEYYCLLQDTKTTLPFAMFCCRVSKGNQLGRGRELTHVAVLDLRNGQLLLEQSCPTTYKMNWTANEDERTLELNVGATISQIRWGNDSQRPPVPLGSLDISESTELAERLEQAR